MDDIYKVGLGVFAWPLAIFVAMFAVIALVVTSVWTGTIWAIETLLPPAGSSRQLASGTCERR